MRHSNAFKFKVAIEATSEKLTLAKLAEKYKVSSSLISKWKDELLKNGPHLFGSKFAQELEQEKKEKDSLYRLVGEQQAQISFLKKAQEFLK